MEWNNMMIVKNFWSAAVLWRLDVRAARNKQLDLIVKSVRRGGWGGACGA
jgi:hypothetical protein